MTCPEYRAQASACSRSSRLERPFARGYHARVKSRKRVGHRTIVVVGGGSNAWAPKIVRDMMLTPAIADSRFVVVIIWQFTQIWNEFLFAVTLSKPASQPITVALAQLAGGEAVKWNLPMAGSLLAALPTLLVYVIFGRFFIRGLLAGSVKG